MWEFVLCDPQGYALIDFDVLVLALPANAVAQLCQDLVVVVLQ